MFSINHNINMSLQNDQDIVALAQKELHMLDTEALAASIGLNLWVLYLKDKTSAGEAYMVSCEAVCFYKGQQVDINEIKKEVYYSLDKAVAKVKKLA